MNKHFIYTGSRSGSNYLVNLLNSHPQITNYGEALGDWTLLYKLHSKYGLGGKSAFDYLNYIYTSPVFFYIAQAYSATTRLHSRKPINFKKRNQVKTIGIKDFHMNLTGDKSDFWSYLKNDDEILIIHLYRENLLKKFISLEKMSSSKIVTSTDLTSNGIGKNQLQKIYINPAEILPRLHKNNTMLQHRMDRLGQLPERRVFHLRYEDLFSSTASQTHQRDKIFQFLGVESINVESSHRKILSKNLSNIIKNYDEVYEALINTQFAKYMNLQD